MSVIIKGMEMPKMCCYCKFREPFLDFAYCDLGEMDMDYSDTINRRHPDCPLVEIPTPHGRLIDADEFENLLNKELLPILIKKYGEEEALKGMHFSFRDCICNIQSQRTVIEAEGSE